MINGLQVSSARILLQKDSGPALARLPKNRLLTAKVISMGPDGRALLRIRNQEVTAQTRLPLTPGEMLPVRVSETREGIALTLTAPPVGGEHPQVNPLKPFLSRLVQGGHLSRTLAPPAGTAGETLESVSLKSGKPDHDFLPKLIQKGGMFLESRLRSLVEMQPNKPLRAPELLKALEQDLKAALVKAGAGDGNTQVQARALETLEAFQLVNTQTPEPGRFVLPFPILEDSGFRFGQLRLETESKEGKEGGGERVIRASFLLDMTGLGGVRADFSFLNKAVNGRFVLEKESSRDLLLGLLPDLKKRLTELGYTVYQIECSLALKEELAPHALMDSLFKKREANSVLNIVI